jgi:hypothetical protein
MTVAVAIEAPPSDGNGQQWDRVGTGAMAVPAMMAPRNSEPSIKALSKRRRLAHRTTSIATSALFNSIGRAAQIFSGAASHRLPQLCAQSRDEDSVVALRDTSFCTNLHRSPPQFQSPYARDEVSNRQLDRTRL